MDKIIGIWKTSDTMIFDETGPKVVPVEEALKLNDNPKEQLLMKAMIKFCDNGDMIECLPLPDWCTKKELDEAIAAGAIKTAEVEGLGTVIRPTVKKWKKEGDNYFYVDCKEGDDNGNYHDHWAQIKFEDNGSKIDLGFSKYVRM